jgi:putative redox protein
LTTTTFDFENESGRLLSGRLEVPAGTARAWALFAHCFTCGKDNIAATRIGRALAASGIGTLRFDFTGLGASGGTFGRSGFSADVGDIAAAAGAMAKAGMAPSLLIGHSFGGAAILAAAARVGSARAVATIAAPFEVDHLLHQFSDAGLARIEAEGEAEVSLAGRPFRVSRGFIEDLRGRDPEAVIASLGRALLVLHSPLDATVGIGNATRIFAAARHPKSFVSLDRADHLLSRRAESDYAASVIAAWAGPYLEPQR